MNLRDYTGTIRKYAYRFHTILIGYLILSFTYKLLYVCCILDGQACPQCYLAYMSSACQVAYFLD